MQKAVITNVSPDVLYLFRVQAVCQHDLRSDFSQTLLFRGTWSKLQRFWIFQLFLPTTRLKNKNAYCLLFSKYNKNI